MAYTKPLGFFLPDIHVNAGHMYIYIHTDLVKFKIGLVFQLLIPACKNVSIMLSCLYFQALAPDDLGGCGLICYPLILSEAPSVSPNTHAFKPRRWHTIPTTLFETIWNGSVEVSSSPESPSWCQSISLFLPLLSSLSFPWLLVSVRSPLASALCSDMLFCFARLGCSAAKQCCLAWPSCKPTTSQAQRGWHHPWVKVTGPVLKATKHSTPTTTTDIRFTMAKPTTAPWATHQPRAVHLW